MNNQLPPPPPAIQPAPITPGQPIGAPVPPKNPSERWATQTNGIQTSLAPPPPMQAQQPLPDHVNHGTVAVEQSRAIAEALGQIQAAKNFPRSMTQVYSKLSEACARLSFAKAATYAYPRSGQTVSGSSIRLAEEIARCYGNISYGIRELSRGKGVSEMQAYAWDLESNVQKTINFTVEHVRDSKQGVKILTDQRDIYEMTGNQGSRRVRSCILAVIGRELEEFALDHCKKTMAGNANVPIQQRINEMVQAFKAFGVNAAHIAHRMNVSLDNLLPDHLAELHGIYNSLRDNMSKPSDWFNIPAASEPAAGTGADKLNKQF